MIKKRNKTIKQAIILAVVLLLIFAVGVIAQALLKSVPVTVNIVENTDVTVYSDPELTQELNSFDIGDIASGASTEYYFYVQNTGSSDINILFSVIGDSSWANIFVLPLDQPIYLAPNNHASCTLVIDVYSGTQTGTKDFIIDISDI